MIDFDYCEKYSRSISNKISHSSISHSADIYRMIKNHNVKEDQVEKLIQNLIFPKGFKEMECYVVHIIELFLYQKI